MTCAAESLTSHHRQAGMTLVELLVAMIVLGVVSSMIVMGWINLQDSYAHTVAANDARATARDALKRMSLEVSTAQPVPGAATGAVITLANPTEVDFYSSFNVVGQTTDGSGTGALKPTRMYLGGAAPYQTLYLQRDSDGTTGFDAQDPQIVLATNVVNNSYGTPIFTYGYRDSSGTYQTTTTIPSASLPSVTLASVISVNMRLMIDANLNHSPSAVDLQTIVRPQNAPKN